MTKPIKSDGGSSSYYDLNIPAWLLDKIQDRGVDEGGAYIKVEEIIECVFDNDFDVGNAFKSLVRGHLVMKGGGKEGNTVDYEMNKVKYSADKVKARYQRMLNEGEFVPMVTTNKITL